VHARRIQFFGLLFQRLESRRRPPLAMFAAKH
jgi:hypothetical protein